MINTLRQGVKRRQIVEVATHGGTSDSANTADMVTLRIQKTGSAGGEVTYTLSHLNQGRWRDLDSFRPFADQKPRKIGLIGHAGGDGYYFDEFELTVK